ncbi:hypothetical protein [Virgibacillus senegalensis]|uniref:hypothetical protein n=1 Tax=Virgibacillus senegalensis TaxID=1499679 RepID=UPI00069D7180|nr:hypothetical protein [Virgibacillus senegalensis]
MEKKTLFLPVVIAALLAGCQASSTAESHTKDNQIDNKLELTVEEASQKQRGEKEEEQLTKELNDLYEMDKYGWGNSELPSMEFGLGSVHFQKFSRSEEDNEIDKLTTFFMDIQDKDGNAILGKIVKSPEDSPEWQGRNARLEKTGGTTAELTIDGTASYTFQAFKNLALDNLYGDWREIESRQTVTFTKGLTNNVHITSDNQELVLAINHHSDQSFSGMLLSNQEEDTELVAKEVNLEVIDERHVKLHSPEGVYDLEKE